MKPLPSLEREAPGGRDPFRRPSRNQHLRRSRRRRFMRSGFKGLGLLAAVLSLATWSTVAGLSWLQSTPVFAIEHVLLEGMKLGDDGDMQRRIAPWVGSNLLATDLEAVRQHAMNAPWVETASVRRVLPDTLAVRVIEKKPMAAAVINGRVSLVDGTGRIIAPWEQRLTGLDMPLLTGVDAWTEEQRQQQLRAGLEAMAGLTALGTEWRHSLSEIDLSRGDRITIRLTDEPAPLYLSRENITVNLDHYLSIRGEIRKRTAAVQAIDLRWRGRVVVVPQSEMIAGNTHKDG